MIDPAILEKQLDAIRQRYRSQQCVKHLKYGNPHFTEERRLQRNRESQLLHREFKQAKVAYIWHELGSGRYRSTLDRRRTSIHDTVTGIPCEL